MTEAFIYYLIGYGVGTLVTFGAFYFAASIEKKNADY